MPPVLFQIVIILLLIVANGILALSELAVVSSRKARLEQLADEGSTGARTALEMANDPGRFLSAVQIGITLVGILAGAFGGVALAEPLAALLARLPLLAPYSNPLAIGLVVATITYFSLVIGELVPKRLALRNPERLAALVAPPLRVLANLASPIVNLLDRSTDLVLRLFGTENAQGSAVTEEEVRILLEQGAEIGVFEPLEEEMVGKVFRLADRRIGAMMTPRREIAWLDVSDTDQAILEKIMSSGHSRYPVADGHLDQVVGVVLTKDLLAQSLAGQTIDISAVMRPPLYVPESMQALKVIERFKETHSKLALVIDEFGGVDGLVTIDDIMEAIVGDIPDVDEPEEVEAIQREDGSWLIDGMFPIDDFQELFGLREMPMLIDGYFQTVGGLMMAALGHIPNTGDHFQLGNLRIEVIDMDGRRVDKVLVTSMQPDEEI